MKNYMHMDLSMKLGIGHFLISQSFYSTFNQFLLASLNRLLFYTGSVGNNPEANGIFFLGITLQMKKCSEQWQLNQQFLCQGFVFPFFCLQVVIDASIFLFHPRIAECTTATVTCAFLLSRALKKYLSQEFLPL